MSARDWFAETFRPLAEVVGKGIADVRSKLIDEGWFGRRTADRAQDNDLGWSLSDRPNAPERENSSALDTFFAQLSPAERAQHLRDPAEQDHDIDR